MDWLEKIAQEAFEDELQKISMSRGGATRKIISGLSSRSGTVPLSRDVMGSTEGVAKLLAFDVGQKGRANPKKTLEFIKNIKHYTVKK